MRPRPYSSAIARWLCAIGLAGVTGLSAVPAYGYWSSGGAGSGSATVATLPAVEVSAVAATFGDSVHLEWEAPTMPPGMAVVGYAVAQVDSTGPTDACASSPGNPLAPTKTSCDIPGLTDGDHQFMVTAHTGPWTTSGSASVTVDADRSAPTVTLGSSDARHAFVTEQDGGYRLFYSAAAGRIALTATVDDTESGPASATFPAVSSQGWSHAAETVTTGSSVGASTTYTSSLFHFDAGAAVPADLQISGADNRGNVATVDVPVVADSNAPSGGALMVNGVPATAAGSASFASGSFSVDEVTTPLEPESASESGLESTVLTRSAAAAASGACGTFGDPTELTGASAQSGLATGCYRYVLTGTDRVGNASSISTTVLVDATAPVGGVVTANGTTSTPSGSQSISASGTWALTRADFGDPDSGLANSVLTRSTASLSGGSCGPFRSDTVLDGSPGETDVSTGCYRYALVGTNAAGLSSTSSVTVLSDRNDPSGGSFRLNGTSAAAEPPSVTSTSGTVTVTYLSQFGDGESGISSSVLSRATATLAGGVCGTFGSEQVVAGTGNFDVSGLASGCHRFTLTGIDNAGRTASVGVIVKVDPTSPLGAHLVVGGVDAAGGVMAVTSSASVPYAWTHFGDSETGMTSGTLTRKRSNSLSNGVCGSSYGAITTLISSLTPSSGAGTDSLPTAGRCYLYELSGTNGFGLASTLSMYLMYDSSGPSSTGSLIVNGKTATTAGVSSTNTTGGFTVSQRKTYSDAQSGIASDVLLRQGAPLAAGVCGAFDVGISQASAAPFDEAGLANGCYRYTQTGTNGVGTSSAVNTTVMVDTTPPSAGTLTANGTAGSQAGTSSYSSTGSWTVDMTNASDSETGATNKLTRQTTSTLSGGACGTFGSASTITTPRTESVTAGCVLYLMTGTNGFGLTAPTITTTVMVDKTAPSGGALTVNGVAATAGGSTSSTAGSFSITGLTNYSDAQSGVASQALTRTYGATCSTLDAGTTATLAGGIPISQSGLVAGCYRYSLTAVNGAGGSAGVSTNVTVS